MVHEAARARLFRLQAPEGVTKQRCASPHAQWGSLGGCLVVPVGALCLGARARMPRRTWADGASALPSTGAGLPTASLPDVQAEQPDPTTDGRQEHHARGSRVSTLAKNFDRGHHPRWSVAIFGDDKFRSSINTAPPITYWAFAGSCIGYSCKPTKLREHGVAAEHSDCTISVPADTRWPSLRLHFAGRSAGVARRSWTAYSCWLVYRRKATQRTCCTIMQQATVAKWKYIIPLVPTNQSAIVPAAERREDV